MSVFASSRRVAIACLSCRERKIKCITSSTDNPCLRCHSNDLPCDYISAVKHRRVRPAPTDTDTPRKRRTAKPDAPSGSEAPARACALRPLRAKHAPYPRHHRAYDGAAEGCWPVVADVAEHSLPPRPCAYPPSICISEREIRQPIPLSSVSYDYDWAPPSRSPSASPIALPLPLPLSSASSRPLLAETREAFVYSHVSQVDDPLEDYWRAFDGGASWHPSHAQEFIGVQLPDAYMDPGLFYGPFDGACFYSFRHQPSIHAEPRAQPSETPIYAWFHSFSVIWLLAQFTNADAAQKAFKTNTDSRGDVFLTERMDAIIDGILCDFNTARGAGVAVVRRSTDGSWVLESRRYGNATAVGAGVTADTVFSIGSNPKVRRRGCFFAIHPQASIDYTPQLFDVIATGLLIHNASLSPRISWDSKTAHILPGWGLMDPVASRESTITDLMSHSRTGLAPHDMMDALAEPVEALVGLHPVPRDRQTDSGTGGDPAADPAPAAPPPVLRLSRARLGMRDTAFFWDPALRGRLADGFVREGADVARDPFDRGRTRTVEFLGGRIRVPAIWLRALLEEGKNAENETIIPAEVIEKAASGIMVYSRIARYPELSPLTCGGGQSRGTYRGFEVIEHGGLTPGFMSQISRIPSQSLGVAVLTNDGSLGNFMMEAIKYRIFDEYFGLAPVDWTARYRERVRSAAPTPPLPRSSRAAAPTAPYAALAGTYNNAAYRDLRLCLFLHGSIQEGGEACEDLAAEVGARLPAVIQPHVPTLIARWATPLTHYLLLEHFDRDPWNLTGLWSHREGEWVQKMTVGMLAEFDGARGFPINTPLRMKPPRRPRRYTEERPPFSSFDQFARGQLLWCRTTRKEMKLTSRRRLTERATGNTTTSPSMRGLYEEEWQDPSLVDMDSELRRLCMVVDVSEPKKTISVVPFIRSRWLMPTSPWLDLNEAGSHPIAVTPGPRFVWIGPPEEIDVVLGNWEEMHPDTDPDTGLIRVDNPDEMEQNFWNWKSHHDVYMGKTEALRWLPADFFPHSPNATHVRAFSREVRDPMLGPHAQHRRHLSADAYLYQVPPPPPPQHAGHPSNTFAFGGFNMAPAAPAFRQNPPPFMNPGLIASRGFQGGFAGGQQQQQQQGLPGLRHRAYTHVNMSHSANAGFQQAQNRQQHNQQQHQQWAAGSHHRQPLRAFTSEGSMLDERERAAPAMQQRANVAQPLPLPSPETSARFAASQPLQPGGGALPLFPSLDTFRTGHQQQQQPPPLLPGPPPARGRSSLDLDRYREFYRTPDANV
ncbi:unnamed protein product [Mycena citricolor]|uniref:Zn(2)-C6 fungal-type domain-containing protein n=1 Tax=Mycena citricolor TaxID=2018698 RepID=A0AAD2H328_9AGAR|nr:unnamed protein product [Mycena citricolor]